MMSSILIDTGPRFTPSAQNTSVGLSSNLQPSCNTFLIPASPGSVLMLPKVSSSMFMLPNTGTYSTPGMLSRMPRMLDVMVSSTADPCTPPFSGLGTNLPPLGYMLIDACTEGVERDCSAYHILPRYYFSVSKQPAQQYTRLSSDGHRRHTV
jgi:hypothetical protein